MPRGPQQPGPPALRRLKTSKDPNPARPEPVAAVGEVRDHLRIKAGWPQSLGKEDKGHPPQPVHQDPWIPERCLRWVVAAGKGTIPTGKSRVQRGRGCRWSEHEAVETRPPGSHMWNWVSRDAEPNGCVAVKCLTVTPHTCMGVSWCKAGGASA